MSEYRLVSSRHRLVPSGPHFTPSYVSIMPAVRSFPNLIPYLLVSTALALCTVYYAFSTYVRATDSHTEDLAPPGRNVTPLTEAGKIYN